MPDNKYKQRRRPMGKRSGQPTKAERLNAKREAAKCHRLDKELRSDEVPDTLPLHEELKRVNALISVKKTEMITWKNRLLLCDGVRWTSKCGHSAHFSGMDSTELNLRLSRMLVELTNLQRRAEQLENLIAPGRQERLVAERDARRRDHAAQLMFWNIMNPDDDGRRIHAQGKKILDSQKKRSDVTVIERRCVGTYVQKNETGNPTNVRCYHSRGDQCLACDCSMGDEGIFVMSTQSQALAARNRLILDTTVVDQQRMALSVVQIGDCVPNIFLPGGPREFDIAIWNTQSTLHANQAGLTQSTDG